MIDNYYLLKKSYLRLIRKQPIILLGYVILPDHMHVLIDINNCNISNVMHRFKASYCALYMRKNKTRKVWQNRFWDHIIRDQNDLNRHLDYMHYNPVKYQLENNPWHWRYSSIHWYRQLYQNDWGVHKKIIFEKDGYGE